MGVRGRIALGAAVSLAALVGIAAPAHGVAGGTVVSSGGWPWAVYLFDNENNFECTGVLISPRVVATAAHCIEQNGDLVATGLDSVEGAEPADFVEVVDSAVIPSYSPMDLDSPDLGRLVLEAPIPDTASIELLEPTESAEVVGTGAIALVGGYGDTADNTSDSGVLRQGAIDELDPCSSQNKFCSTSGPPTVCGGDSGGPLIVQLGADTITANPDPSNGEWRLAGITNFGDQDCSFFAAFSSLLDTEQRDFLAPVDTTITKGPKRKVRGKRATFEFSASSASGDTLAFKCSLDREEFEACSSPHTTRKVSKGKHLFEVRAIAGAMEDLTPASHRWRRVEK
ncbi:MAG: chymotrypsin [Solirubrobacterales bacterium]|jgi:secreted trypsin-like serine protease|nr:chymotrypsin [Solirubrobacterales bacterium]